MDDDLRMLREAISRYVDAEMLPLDAKWRADHRVDKESWRKIGAAGFLLMDVPAEYGGGGGDFRHETLLYEELNRRGISGFGQGVHSIAAHYVLNYGTEAQKQRWLPRMACGELVGAIAMTEPGAGSDLKGIRTRAVRTGDQYVINGSKIFITNGGSAGLLMLVVRTDPADRSRGLSILMVETEGLKGYRVGRVLDKMGFQAQDTAELFFEDVRVPVDCLLQQEGKGMHQLMGDLPYERLLIAVAGVAAMEGALDETIKYVNERQVFGQPVAAFQNTKFKLAEAATHTRVARVFIDRCIEQLVRGELDTETAAMAKWWVTDMQQKVIDECQQLFGGYGYMNEYVVCRMFADSRVQRIYGGTNEVMKELISRSL
ncbi:MAG: acyl-CoA dehydrogenase family protein [Steroidobacteraceae bacterium]|nr:acyl-CoA dehydrogenase family protein [Steroidobacteraceae bacterium]MBP7015415.1 acyl-CoA dehydrogenase family protein [Steroidobacteraceae bacterium]